MKPRASRSARGPKARAVVAPGVTVQTATADWIVKRILFHIRHSRGKSLGDATDFDKYLALSMAVRDLTADRLIATQQAYLDRDVKRVYYLSMEFLIGRILQSNILSLGLAAAVESALCTLQFKPEILCQVEPDAGLGNGGLGRLAACFLDSLATQAYPAYGYGVRYEHGMFRQEFDNGWQTERPDDWLKYRNPWEMVRPEATVPVLVYGRIEDVRMRGVSRPLWVDWQMFEGVPHDLPVVGYGVHNVNMLRLWSSRAAEGFRLDIFNSGDYVNAVAEKNWAETVSKVLYPSDNTAAGRELRLVQEYFLVACSVRDMVQRYRKNHAQLDGFGAKNAIQLNDTHPSLAVAELMRQLVDEHNLPWEPAWEITTQALAYTNHTLLPEALEKWPVPLLERVLPRHLQIIYEINHRFLQDVIRLYPDDPDRVRRLSLIEEEGGKQVRMAHLAVVGSHAVNGVSQLHTELLKTRLMPDFARMWPERFQNKTNGITPRRWLDQCNPGLARLITETIGDGWQRDLGRLRELEPYAGRADFQQAFLAVKRANKLRLAAAIQAQLGIPVDPDSLFDVQIKRLHEYKRQLLNALHIIALYHRIRDNPQLDVVPRTFIFAAKAAPGYYTAKRIIKLINTLAEVVNHDAAVRGRLTVAFLPDYNVSLAEVIVPAADLSEQISTAGTEASGTGNMKLALNGALTIGTWDGANIEIAGEVGLDNIFIFGRRAGELEQLRRDGYRPAELLAQDGELRRAVEALRGTELAPHEPGVFDELYRSLAGDDHYFHLADFRSYAGQQAAAAKLYRDRPEWARKAILNVARMGWFSSDRTVREYAEEIWHVSPLPVSAAAEDAERSLDPA
ncbi:MAG: glycogen/starch/alpha-glucan phosphorylase [bacterium]